MSKQIFDAMFTKGLLCNLSEESTLNTYGEAVIKLVMLSNRTINFPRLASLLEKIPKRDIEKVIMVSFYIRGLLGEEEGKPVLYCNWWCLHSSTINW